MTGKKGDFMETISLNRRSLFSRTSGLLVMLMLLLNLCGCADFLKQLKKDSYNLNTFMNMDQIEKETKEVSDSIVKILDKKDEKALEELFSEESRELCTDFDAGVEYLFDTYEGKSKKVSDYNFGANEINSPQRLTQVVYGSCTVETSKEEYRLYWAKYVRCKGLKERAGLWSIRIVRADEDQDKRGSLLPGIELPEWADTSALVVDLIEIMHSDEGITGDPSSLLSDDLLGKMSPEEKDAFTTLACSINRDTVSTIRLDKKDPNRVFLPFEVLGKGMYVASITCDEKITGLRITEYMKKMPSEKECRAVLTVNDGYSTQLLVDGVSFYAPEPVDVRAIAITSPQLSAYADGGNLIVEAEFANYGSETVSDYEAKLEVDGQELESATLPDIASGATVNFSFDSRLQLADGTHTLAVIAGNDSEKKSLVIYQPQAYPYQETFEDTVSWKWWNSVNKDADPVYWTVMGVVKGNINYAKNGTHAAYVSSAANIVHDDWLISPAINITKTGRQRLSFFYVTTYKAASAGDVTTLDVYVDQKNNPDTLSEKDRAPVSGSSTVCTSFRAHFFGSFGWTGPAGSGAAVVSAAVFFAAVCPPPFPEVPPHAASRTLPASSRESILLFIFLFLSCHYLWFCESTSSVFIIIKNPAGNGVTRFLSMTEWVKTHTNKFACFHCRFRRRTE